MSRDLELLRQAELGQVAARAYCWGDVWVTLGRSQHPEDALVDPVHTQWVGRPTGGGAVLHGHDLTVAIAIPMRRSVRHSYRIAAAPLIESFNLMGVPAVLNEDVPGEHCPLKGTGPADCFARTAVNDIVHGQTLLKICGCALRRTSSAVLLQASIPISFPSRDPAQIIIGGVRVQPASIDASELVRTLREGLAHTGSLGSRV